VVVVSLMVTRTIVCRVLYGDFCSS
jgi:hypothetical protein